jgi:NAD(P)-dependent dehydrogenase (short-subunit alcohol dehydrogenase family)
MSGRLEGKVALITGAAGGLGRATALRFAREGALLALTDVDEVGLSETARAVTGAGPSPLASVVDLCTTTSFTSLVDDVVVQFGRLDILDNNAGVVVAGHLEDHTVAMWDLVHNVNVRSPFFLAQAAIPAMIRNGGGSIINISSISGILGNSKLPAYCSSKAALIGLTRSLALDWAESGVRVNVIVPGRIDTNLPGTFIASFPESERAQLAEDLRKQPRQLMRRPASPDEIANAVLFLASDEASYVTGSVYNVDGGYAAW